MQLTDPERNEIQKKIELKLKEATNQKNGEILNIKDGGVLYNEQTGITEGGKKIMEQFREILIKAGW